jgi:hypothetical protein
MSNLTSQIDFDEIQYKVRRNKPDSLKLFISFLDKCDTRNNKIWQLIYSIRNNVYSKLDPSEVKKLFEVAENSNIMSIKQKARLRVWLNDGEPYCRHQNSAPREKCTEILELCESVTEYNSTWLAPFEEYLRSGEKKHPQLWNTLEYIHEHDWFNKFQLKPIFTTAASCALFSKKQRTKVSSWLKEGEPYCFHKISNNSCYDYDDEWCMRQDGATSDEDRRWAD